MARYKRRKKLQLTMFECILILIGGLLLGIVFTFDMHYWNAPIPQEDAVCVTATYDGYDIRYSFGKRSFTRQKINVLEVHFADHPSLTLDGSCVTDDRLDALTAVRCGTQLEMLVHPNSDTLLAITAPSGPILTYEDATRALTFEMWGFFILGVFCYIWAGVAAYYLIARKYY